MPYKYISEEDAKELTNKPPKPLTSVVKTEDKEPEKPKTLTEEESQELTVKEHEDKFFDEDDDIIEVNFD